LPIPNDTCRPQKPENKICSEDNLFYMANNETAKKIDQKIDEKIGFTAFEDFSTV